MDTKAELPGSLRARIILLLFFFSFTNHFNRVSISVAGADISNDLGIDPVGLGMVISSFLVTYTLFMAPGGRINDSFATRIALAT